jgi:type IV pilus assembly protein PilB
MESVNFLAQNDHLKVEYYLISKKSFEEGYKQYEKMEEEVSTALRVKAKAEGTDIIQVKQESSEILSEEDVNSAPIAKIVSVIIRHAVESRASDIHIEPYEKESRVRYRIDGILHNSLVLPKNVHSSVVARIKVLAKLKLQRKSKLEAFDKSNIYQEFADIILATIALANTLDVDVDRAVREKYKKILSVYVKDR